MRLLHATNLALVLLASAVGAAPDDRPIVLPQPAVVPSPMPSPGAAVKLAGDAVYVVDSKVDCIVRTSPPGLVEVTKLKGPRDITAVFVDGKDTEEDRTFAGPFLYRVRAKGTGTVTIDEIPLGLKSDAEIVSGVIDVDAGQSQRKPCPKPKPVPPTPVPPQPNPPDPPGPVPVPVATGTWVVVVADEGMPAVWQGQVLDGPTLRALKAKGECRIYGNVTEADKIAAKKYDQLMKDATVSAPCVLVLDKNGKKVAAFALPQTDSDLAAKLKGVVP